MAPALRASNVEEVGHPGRPSRPGGRNRVGRVWGCFEGRPSHNTGARRRFGTFSRVLGDSCVGHPTMPVRVRGRLPQGGLVRHPGRVAGFPRPVPGPPGAGRNAPLCPYIKVFGAGLNGRHRSLYPKTRAHWAFLNSLSSNGMEWAGYSLYTPRPLPIGGIRGHFSMGGQWAATRCPIFGHPARACQDGGPLSDSLSRMPGVFKDCAAAGLPQPVKSPAQYMKPGA